MCRNNGLDAAPICAFDRWICNAKLKDEAELRKKLSSSRSSSVWEPVLPVAGQAAWTDKELVDDLVPSRDISTDFFVLSY